MILMLTADESWNIGVEGKMLVDLEEDLERFKEKTTDNIIIMGRTTLEAIPSGGPLANRLNIVMTRNKDFKKEGIVTANSVDHLLEILEEINPEGEMKVFVTGGESIVRQLLKYCDKAFITKILKNFSIHDRKIPNLDEDKDWYIADESALIRQDDVEYKYVEYRRIKE